MPGVRGIKSGFIRFDSAAHNILKCLHENGDCCLVDFVKLDCGDYANLAMSLTKLVRYRFIYKVDKISKYESGFEKTQMKYSLFKKKKHRTKYYPATQAIKDAHRHAKRRVMVSSIFAFRGSISIARNI